jgi:hypothetical protein
VVPAVHRPVGFENPVAPRAGFSFPELSMQWIEALINVSAFAGFIGIASAWPENNQ